MGVGSSEQIDLNVGMSSYGANSNMQYFDIPQQQQLSPNLNMFMNNPFGGYNHDQVEINLLNHK